MRRFHLQLLVLLTALLLVGGKTCLATETGEPEAFDWTELDEEEEALEVWDPIEPFNRGIFWFNDKLYFYLLKPAARGYRVVAPEPVRESVGNFFDNLGAPIRVVNALLQGRVQKGLNELTIFVANSTFGLGGLFDLHADADDRPAPEDFGQTLGHYGAGPGFYLVLPVFGPSNLRDGVGLFTDRFADPLSSPYYLKLHDYETIGAKTFDTVNRLSLDKDTYEAIKRESLDPYLFIRNAYMQNRAASLKK